MFQEILEERTLLQFHYTEWPSHTCPFSNSILEFRRRVRMVVAAQRQTEQHGPCVVHCRYQHLRAHHVISVGLLNGSTGDILTHGPFFSLSFSDGAGRSGVYLAIDANLELAEEEDCFDVFGYLKKLRQSRKGMIDNVVSPAP